MHWGSWALWVLLGIRPHLFFYRTAILDVSQASKNALIPLIRMPSIPCAQTLYSLCLMANNTTSLCIFLLRPAQMITPQAAVTY